MKKCRGCQEAIDTDRDFLVLHCQQFAFANDMVGACADILTCRDTRLPYRADIFNGNPYHREHEDKVYNEPEYHDHSREHDHFYPEESPYGPIEVGHYTEEDLHHAEDHHDHYDHH